MKKNIAWIDTIRVLASLMIIFAHVFMCDGFFYQPAIRNRAFDIAVIGVFLFFAISGYLIHGSLERSPSLWEFYKRKLIRIVVPFTVCYLVLSVVLSVLAIVNVHTADKVPLFHAMYGEKYFQLILGMFPVDINVTKFLGYEVKWFVGEWFIGVIIWMYLVSPLLDKLAVRAPLVTLAASIAISFAVYYASLPLNMDGRIHASWGLFIVRIPEFLFGMMLFIHRERLLKLRRILLPAVTLYLAAYVAYFVYNYPPQGAFFFIADPSCFATTLPVIYFAFNVAELLNEHASKVLDWFNGFNSISYMAMLIQHVVIYLFEGAYRFEDLHSFGKVYVFFLITWVIILVSRWLKPYSDSVENYLLRKS